MIGRSVIQMPENKMSEVAKLFGKKRANIKRLEHVDNENW